MELKPDLIWDDVDGHLVICDLVRNQFFELNRTATLIWRSLAAGGIRAADDALRSAYPELASTILEKDLRSILRDLGEAGLTIPSSANGKVCYES